MKNPTIFIVCAVVLAFVAIGVVIAFLTPPTVDVPQPPIDVENPPVSDDPTPDADVAEGLVLFEDKGVKIVLKSYVYPSIKLVVENTTDKDIVINVNNVLVNEVAVAPCSEIQVPTGATEKEEITWLAEDLEANNITEIENVKFYFSIADGIETIVTSDIIEIVLN